MIRLKLWRLQRGLTQDRAAEKLGVGESTLALLESGRLKPTVGQLKTLRRYFGDQIDAVLLPVPEQVEGDL